MFFDKDLNITIRFNPNALHNTNITVISSNTKHDTDTNFPDVHAAYAHLKDSMSKLGYNIVSAAHSKKFVDGEGFMIKATRD